MLVARHRATILSRTKLCKQQTLCALTHLNQAHSQSDYSMKPRGTYNTRENVISASKSAFVPTSSPSGVATKNRLSIVLLCQDQRTKQPLGHFQNLGLKIAKTEFW
ncbi:hypothetical protein CGJ22_24740 [Vibrio parahaemolyticus]|nr:hypothetical protein CGJ22_24740 [Vibrio parahaemolyticus]